jgi:hypothetical protein
MLEVITPISEEIGKLKGNIKRLWELSKQSPLNRDDCKNIVLEIRKSFRVLWTIIQDTILERVKESDHVKYLLFTIIAGKNPEEFIKEAFKWPPYESEISTVISRLDSPEYYKDREVKESIARLVENLEAELRIFELKLNLKQGVSKISEFLTTFPRFTENWSVAICYLTAMEIMVKEKLKELGLEISEEFKNNYKKLLEKLKERNVKVSGLEEQLPSVFWNIRNKVVHEGYSPNSEELEIITKYVENILKLLISLR